MTSRLSEETTSGSAGPTIDAASALVAVPEAFNVTPVEDTAVMDWWTAWFIEGWVMLLAASERQRSSAAGPATTSN